MEVLGVSDLQKKEREAVSWVNRKLDKMNRVGDKMNQQTQSREGTQQAADEGSFSSLDLSLEEQ